MKKVLAVARALMLALGFAAVAEGNDLLSKIQERGTIVIATEGDWSPWTYRDDSGEWTGLEIEIGNLIAQGLGVEADFQKTPWDAILAGVDSGRFDIACNGVGVTEERAEKYAFTEPYLYTEVVLVVRADNEEIRSFADLQGKTTANSIGSTYMELAEQYGATVSGVDTLDETIQMVLQGRVDATLNADQSFFDYLREHPDAEIKIVAETEEAGAIAIPMRKGAETASLRAAVDQAILDLKADGTLTKLSETYFGADISQ